MLNAIEMNWAIFAVALLAALLVAWWLFGRAATGARPRERRPDVLDEGQAPAQRNQALIDAAPAAQLVPPPISPALGGLAEAVAIGARDVVEEAEAIAAETPPPAIAPEREPEPEPARQSEPAGADDLSRIKGLGPKLQALLPTLGITTFAQLAALDEAGLAELDGKLGAFAGRPAKDNWVEQAGFLAAGDVAGFEAKFGKV
jgi:predicted flap endonuclease-1-like 5' DNA nuclease